MKSFYALSFFSILISNACQSSKHSCDSIKNGRFYVYPPYGEDYLVIRKDSIQSEVNLTTGDTSYWRIQWLSDCAFSAQYISGGAIESEEHLEFLRKTTSEFTIQKVSFDYYVFSAQVITPKGSRTYTDTTWRKVKGK